MKGKYSWLATILFAAAALALPAQEGPNGNGVPSPAPSAQAPTSIAPGMKFHIGIVTGSIRQFEDEYRGAEALVAEYGSVDRGGIVRHLVHAEDYFDQPETLVSMILDLAGDPLMKAIIVNQAIPGTSEAFRRVRERRPDILLIAGEPHEEPRDIQTRADLVVGSDFVSRGYLIVWAAKQLGATSFVHVSFPRHMSYETLARRCRVMEEACRDLGLAFAQETAPDPTSDVGVAGAQQYILEKTPQWIKKYGKATAFFCTSGAHEEPLLKQLLAYGGFLVESEFPSPFQGIAGVLGLDLSASGGDFQAILRKVEKAVVAQGGSGRFGTWVYTFGSTVSAGLGEYAIRLIVGAEKRDDPKALYRAFEKYSPGAEWNGNYCIDPRSGIAVRNHILVYQDTYVYGKGYMHSASQPVPEKYFLIRPW